MLNILAIILKLILFFSSNNIVFNDKLTLNFITNYNKIRENIIKRVINK